ncbi:MAG: helix-turn-helix domain-containing protein [Nitrosomonadaceae bacterium]
MKQFKTILKKEMDKNASVRALATLSGVSTSVVQGIRNGSDCKVSTMIKLCEVLNIKIYLEVDDGERTRLR